MNDTIVVKIDTRRARRQRRAVELHLADTRTYGVGIFDRAERSTVSADNPRGS